MRCQEKFLPASLLHWRSLLQSLLPEQRLAHQLLRELRQWCADAEASGIEALNDFVRELKSYSVPRLALNRG